jgi:hypothetical protein
MHNELIVPLLVSLGLITLMARALTFPAFRLQHAHMSGPLRLSCAEHLPAGIPVANSESSYATRAAAERTLFIDGLCRSLARYRDCRAALADNYLSRASDETQSIWEFTNYWYGFKAAFDFDPDHPTSLIYQRNSQGEYHLIGAAFTAPERFTPEQRRERIGDNIAEWQPHGMFGWVARIYFRGEDVDQKKAS